MEGSGRGMLHGSIGWLAVRLDSLLAEKEASKVVSARRKNNFSTSPVFLTKTK